MRAVWGSADRPTEAVGRFALLQWVNDTTRDMLHRCRIIAHDGTVLYTPDGSAALLQHTAW